MAPNTYQITVFQAEQNLLSNLISSEKKNGNVLQNLKPIHFADSRHQVIYSNIIQLMLGMTPLDTITLKSQLLKNRQLEIAGGLDYIDSLQSTNNDALLTEEYYRIVLYSSKKKRLGELGDELSGESNDPSVDVGNTMNKAIARLEEINSDNERKPVQAFSSVAENILYEALQSMNNPDGITGVETGFHELDRITGGFNPGELVIIAARPAMGKTAFVMSMLLQSCMRMKHPVAFFSLEMSNQQMVTRLLSQHSGIAAEKIRGKKLDSDEFKKLHLMTGEINDGPLYMVDEPGLTIQRIRFMANRMKHQHGIEMLIVDYLQLIGVSSSRTHSGNREAEISAITRGLKTLARELDIPVIVTSQLSRAVETRGGDKKPILSDLRESGAIEQEADKVLFLYRGEYYGLEQDCEGNPTKDIAEVIVAKNRFGPVGTSRLRFINGFARFENLTEADQAEQYTEVDLENQIKKKYKKLFSGQSDDNLTPF
jgi:replicative DNA helicase